ncbi:pirin family protein [Parachitinimonas caeni]|uniref:Pirin family protein n=1 Tax=Parachitinimonas caeni TaxID=3031301 RepID=A0ABT7DX17_9NEIS|nr:pirin family protein [Parachitinimonas caeni]MDK2124606.1 pirin family protein [Parachitinimonas caeni]
MHEIRKADDRGMADLGWLFSRHTFSFGDYFDAHQRGFSDLLVINDDKVEPGGGFETHSHHDMEIISYVLSGALEHEDSTGEGSVIQAGDVQAMSAGRGIDHSEYNHSDDEPVHFLQIWILPNRLRVEPRYQQRHVSAAEKRGCLRLIASAEGTGQSLRIHQDVRIYAGLFDGDETAQLDLPGERFAYIHLARGSACINGLHLQEGDGVRIRHEPTITISEGEQAEVLVFDLRPNEKPRMT